MGTVESRDVVVSGKNVHAWVGGRGPGLLLLHSAWGDARLSWSPVWEELSKTFTVVAPDMPGYGRSDVAQEPGVTGSARLMGELLNALKLDRVVVVGNSMGVSCAIEVACLFPDRVTHLVAVNGSSVPHIPGFVKPLFRLPFMKRMILEASWSDQAYAKGFPDQAALPAGFIDKIRNVKDKHGPLGFELVAGQRTAQRRPSVPVTVVWGTGDRLVPRKQAQAFFKWIGKHRYVPLEGAGHMPQVERPAEFVSALRSLSTAQRAKDEHVVPR